MVYSVGVVIATSVRSRECLSLSLCRCITAFSKHRGKLRRVANDSCDKTKFDTCSTVTTAAAHRTAAAAFRGYFSYSVSLSLSLSRSCARTDQERQRERERERACLPGKAITACSPSLSPLIPELLQHPRPLKPHLYKRLCVCLSFCLSPCETGAADFPL